VIFILNLESHGGAHTRGLYSPGGKGGGDFEIEYPGKFEVMVYSKRLEDMNNETDA
jgi:hypothetical protein